MKSMPKITRLSDGSSVWSNTFEKFEATVYVPLPEKSLMADVMNYGFIAPYLLVFAENKLSYEEAAAFAKEKGFAKLAADFASSVVFIYPTSGDWKTAAPDLFSEIISRIFLR